MSLKKICVGPTNMWPHISCSLFFLLPPPSLSLPHRRAWDRGHRQAVVVAGGRVGERGSGPLCELATSIRPLSVPDQPSHHHSRASPPRNPNPHLAGAQSPPQPKPPNPVSADRHCGARAVTCRCNPSPPFLPISPLPLLLFPLPLPQRRGQDSVRAAVANEVRAALARCVQGGLRVGAPKGSDEE